MDKKDGLGFVKYEGKYLADGAMDIRRQAKSLNAIDDALRYALNFMHPQLKEFDYEIPVVVRKGSWEVIIPNNVAQLGGACLLFVLTAYATAAVQKVAENDFKDVKSGDIFRGALKLVISFAKISKHMGSAAVKRFENASFDGPDDLIGIKNEFDEILYVSKRDLDFYIQAKPSLINPLVENIDSVTDLKIGVAGSCDDEVHLENNDRSYFIKEQVDEELVLFPELRHGDLVSLEGELTRGNKMANTMGFKYEGRILSVYPDSGSIVRYKGLLFTNCKITGVVDRIDENGNVGANRPKIVFRRLEAVTQQDLFEEELN